KEGEIVLDLYCGTGTIGLSLYKEGCRLIGADIVPSSIENAKKNAAQNGIDAEFICADAAKAAEVFFDRGERPDVIIADPARKGCDRATLELMAKMEPKRIVMISCDHSTAARDIAILRELGYEMSKCAAVDMFARTAHVECVCLLSKLSEA
ncbi:MAG: class I SAM-dependent RNA methyltransferase, partial [Ruminococcus sp.]|nr:class I SAM-dependent RNA methyltransferase [Ruminococcus sp.]